MAILTEKTGLSNLDIRKLRSLRPGAPLDIQINTPTVTKRARTELVGIDGTRSIIMQFPDESKWGSISDLIYVDNHLIVRAILEEETGEVIAFKVKVSMILTKPGHLIFTTFPLALQSQDLRAEKRAKINIPSTVFDLDGATKLANALVVDISAGGCRIAIDRLGKSRKLVSKQKIFIQIGKASAHDEVLRGTIMNSKLDGQKIYHGIKFEQSEAVVSALLNKLMISI